MTEVSTRLVTSMFRASYPHLFNARAVKVGDTPRFSVAMLIPPDEILRGHPDADKLIADRKRFMGELSLAVAAAKKKTFGDNVPLKLKTTIYKAEEEGRGECYEPGWTLIRGAAPADKKPTVLLPKRDPSTGKWLPCPEEDFYAGCWARASIDVYGYNRPDSKGISVGLNFVQKIKDGDRLDNRPVAEDALGDLDFGGASGSAAADADSLFG